MRIAAACVFLAASLGAAHAAVDGTVTNATTGKPQAGSTVTLFQPTDQGPQFIDSVKTDAAGKFTITKEIPAGSPPGPLLLQAVYDGVQYNQMLTPGTPTTGVDIPVYESSKQPGGAKISQHVMLIEPSGGTMAVAESYIFNNDGNTTWNNPETGTLQFMLPPAAGGKVEINVQAPGGLFIRRAADPAGKPNTFKLDFPIKPGASEVRMEWSMPFTSPGVFEDAILAKGAPDLKLLAPVGVTLTGDGITSLGKEPTTGATIYNVAPAKFALNVEGSGTLKTGTSDDEDNGSPKVSENMPQLYGLTLATGDPIAPFLAVKWVVISILGMLAIGFALLYRKGNPLQPKSDVAAPKFQPCRAVLAQSTVSVFGQPASDSGIKTTYKEGDKFAMTDRKGIDWIEIRSDSGEFGYIPSSTRVKTTNYGLRFGVLGLCLGVSVLFSLPSYGSAGNLFVGALCGGGGFALGGLVGMLLDRPSRAR